MGNFTSEIKRDATFFGLALALVALILCVCIPGQAQAEPESDSLEEEPNAVMYADGFAPGFTVLDSVVSANQRVYVKTSNSSHPVFDQNDGTPIDRYYLYLFPGQKVVLNYEQARTEKGLRFNSSSSLLSLGRSQINGEDIGEVNDSGRATNTLGREVLATALSDESPRGQMGTITVQADRGNLFHNWQTIASIDIYVMPSNIDMYLYTNITNTLPGELNAPVTSANFLPGQGVLPAQATLDLQAAAHENPMHFFMSQNADGTTADMYLSIQNYPNAQDMQARAKGFYFYALAPHFTDDTKQIVANTFGTGAFGYVLKFETTFVDGCWHMDGMLANDPPNYIVSLSEQGADGKFHVLGRDTVTYSGDVQQHSYDKVHKEIYTRTTDPGFDKLLGKTTDRQYRFAGWDTEGYPQYEYKDADGYLYRQSLLPKTDTYKKSGIAASGEDNFYFEYSRAGEGLINAPLAENYIAEVYLTQPVKVNTAATINVSKKVTGIGGDENKDFDFYLEIDEDALDTLNGKNGASVQDYNNLVEAMQKGVVFTKTFPDGRPAEQWTDSFLNYQKDGKYTGHIPFMLRHGEQVSIDVQVLPARVQPGDGSANLPEFNYRVQERALDGLSSNPIYLTVKMYTGNPDSLVEVQSGDATHYEPIGTSGALRYKNIIPQADATFNLVFENNFNPPMAGYKNGDITPYVVSTMILLGSVGMGFALRVLKRRRDE